MILCHILWLNMIQNASKESAKIAAQSSEDISGNSKKKRAMSNQYKSVPKVHLKKKGTARDKKNF